MAAWNARVSGSSWVRRRSSRGVRSPPPPNHHLRVTTMRVFMCAVGACGLTGWAISDTPEAQKRGSSSAPGICLRNSGANSPCTVEVWMPAFSNTRPRIRLMTPPPPSAPPCSSVIGARPGRAHEACRRPVAERRARRQLRLEPLEGRAQLVAQRLEPGARALLLLRQRIVGFGHGLRFQRSWFPRPRAGAADWRCAMRRAAGRYNIPAGPRHDRDHRRF